MSPKGEYLQELPKGFEYERAKGFAKSTEIIFINQFGFRYILNHNVLKKSEIFNEILTAVQREEAGENVIKKVIFDFILLYFIERKKRKVKK